MQRFYLCVLSLMLVCLTGSLFAQRELKLSPKDVKSMSKVKLEVEGRTYPSVMLYNSSRDKLTVLRESGKMFEDRPIYLTADIRMDDIDKITIYNRKRKVWGQLIGGVTVGATSYFVVDQIYTNKMRNPFLEILNQAPEHRFVEPIVAAILGAGVGVIVGELLSPVRIDMRKDRKEAYEKLRKYSYR